ncbi:MAG: M48 family metalloprotease [Proteobacteria bacterium]|nr:M48 family metalloprotease [Pseudomonadota bacterium]
MRLGLCLMLVVAMLASSAFAAKVKPVSELTSFPENDKEYTLWQLAGEHESRIDEQQRRYRNVAVEAYVKSIVMKMIGSRLDHVNVDIEIILVREPTLSAWVYPYGDIAIHTGLLAWMENEAQLAAILGHEISHFLHRHSYRELIVEKQQSAFGKGLGLLVSAAVAAETGRMPTNLMDGVGNFWTGLVTNGYSRKLEHAADEGGLELMADANYDRGQALLAFKALKQNDVYGAVNVATLWSSHPTLDDRIKNLEKNILREARRKGYQPGTVPESHAYYEAIAPVLLFNASLDLEDRYFERARTALTKYLSIRQEPTAEFLLGESFRKANPDGPDFSMRMAAYGRAIALDETFAAAHKERGMALRRQGNSREALTEFQRYLSLAPQASDAGIIRGYMADME